MCFFSISSENMFQLIKNFGTQTKHSVHPPAFLLGGVEPPTKFFKKGGLEMTSTLRGRLLEKGGNFFQGGEVAILQKNKIK